MEKLKLNPISESELTGNQPEQLRLFKLRINEKYAYLGGTTYRYSVWAVRYNGKIEIYSTPYDFQGRWVRAKCRKWNQKLTETKNINWQIGLLCPFCHEVVNNIGSYVYGCKHIKHIKLGKTKIDFNNVLSITFSEVQE